MIGLGVLRRALLSRLNIVCVLFLIGIAGIGFIILVPSIGNIGREGATEPTRQGEYVTSFPRESVDASIYLRKPSALSVDPLGNIYVVDSGQNKILVFSKKGELLRNIGRSGQGPGDLLAPEKICFDEANTLYVYESANGRIQLFNNKGEFIKGFKVYKYIQALKARGNNVYCACRQQVPNNPLIEILDLDGRIVGMIGSDERIDNIDAYRRKSLDFKRFDISDSGQIWFAWEYFSWIQGYSLDGGYLGVIDLSVSKLAEWSRQNLNAFFKAPTKPALYRSVIFALRAKGDFLYLLSSSEDGAEVTLYSLSRRKSFVYKLTPPAKGEFRYYKDFDLIIEDGDLMFFLLQVSPENCIDVFKVAAPGRRLH
jgi:6-bladed beta-propeller